MESDYLIKYPYIIIFFQIYLTQERPDSTTKRIQKKEVAEEGTEIKGHGRRTRVREK